METQSYIKSKNDSVYRRACETMRATFSGGQKVISHGWALEKLPGAFGQKTTEKCNFCLQSKVIQKFFGAEMFFSETDFKKWTFQPGHWSVELFFAVIKINRAVIQKRHP